MPGNRCTRFWTALVLAALLAACADQQADPQRAPLAESTSGATSTTVAHAIPTLADETAAPLLAATPTLAVTITPSATPKRPTDEPVIAGTRHYIIQPGDTLEAIAAQLSLSVADLVALNGLSDPNEIVAGASLFLPPCALGDPECLSPTTAPGAATPTGTPARGTLAATATATALAATPTPPPLTPFAPGARYIGDSYEGRSIEHYIFGDGPVDVAFVGAIHGGYEWNTANLAYEMVAHFARRPGDVPDALTLHIIPVANPDGLARVAPEWTGGLIPPPTGVITATFPGRFNGRDVDLNRNWDCNWQPSAVWRDQEVHAGTAPFSESENVALRDLFLNREMAVVVFWHSAGAVVLPGGCLPDEHPPSRALAEVYATAVGYPVATSLNYEISGDASDWLTTQNIPSFAVELSNHTALDWQRNLAGTMALLAHVANSCLLPECGR